MTNEEKLLEELRKLEEEREKKEREKKLRQDERDKKLDEELWGNKKKSEEESWKRKGEYNERIKEREEKEEKRKKDIETRIKAEEKEQERLNKLAEEIQERRKLQNLPKKFFASLLAPSGSTAINTDSGTMPVFYVIVGRGPAAIINHTTLRQTKFGKKRIAGLPVMHVGFANPWTKYMHHGMGQPPYLLNLPGFEEHPSPKAVYDAGLDSKHFGKCVEGEYERLKKHYGEKKVLTEEAWVVWIQSWKREPLGVDTEDELRKDGMLPEFCDLIAEKLCEEFKSKIARYRLLVMKPKPGNELKKEDIYFIYASHIDICTGPGRPIVMPPGKGDTDECKKARTAAWLSPETWSESWGEELKKRIVLNGVDAIRDEIQWKSGERVCVTAGGGVGLNAAERARNNDCKLDWFGRTTLMETFANPRNDTILKHPKEDRILNPGESKILGWKKDDDIIPCKNDLRYGYGATLDDAKIEKTQVKVILKAGNKANIKDFFNKQVGFLGTTMWDFSTEYAKHIDQKPSEMYDRLVIPNGQASKSLGHAYYFARHLGLKPMTNGLQMIGLNTNDGRIRVLGAAAQTYDGYGFGQRGITTYFGEKMWLYWDSLPVSAVPDGFIFSGINIAVANEFFSADKPNNNLTTASQREIEKILKTKVGTLEALYIAKVIIDKRRRPNNNGYESMEKVIEALKNDERTREIPSIEKLITELFDVFYTKSKASDLLDDM